METIFCVALLLGYFGYQSYLQGKEKIATIRELTTSIKSNGIKEYLEAIPEPTVDSVELIKDELVEIGDIDPMVLLKSLK